MTHPTATPLEIFLAAVEQFQHARRTLFNTLAQHPHIVLQYTETLNGRFAKLDGGDLLHELHLCAQQKLSAPPKRPRRRGMLVH